MVIYTTGQIRKLNFYFKNPAIFKLHKITKSRCGELFPPNPPNFRISSKEIHLERDMGA
jgi:hypothetical protein